MKNFITEEVKEDFLESLKTTVSYPSVLKECQMEHLLDKLSKMS